MCSEKYVSVSQIYPIICGLLRKSLVINEDDSSSVRRTKDSIREELNRRYKPSAKSIPELASFLGPRYKRLTFLSSDQKKKIAKKKLRSEWMRSYSHEWKILAPVKKLMFARNQNPPQALTCSETKWYWLFYSRIDRKGRKLLRIGVKNEHIGKVLPWPWPCLVVNKYLFGPLMFSASHLSAIRKDLFFGRLTSVKATK